MIERYPIHGIIRNKSGVIVPDTDISIYYAGTTNPATISESISGDKISTAPQTSSDSNGQFSIYFDFDDYDNGEQFFDISTDYSTISNISVFFSEEDEIKSGTETEPDTSGWKENTVYYVI